MSRIETIGNATLYLGDNRLILPTLGMVDAVVTDPPYGIGATTWQINRGGRRHGAAIAPSTSYDADDWDKEPPPAWLIAMLRDVSRWQVIFGGNYFDLPPARCWLVWDKRTGDNDYADCELAWSNLDKPVRKIEWLWKGMMRKGSDKREHPTQKPLGVMAWCLDQLPDDVATICDPFMGSGTTGVAALRKGLKFIGIERSERYFDAACGRLKETLDAPKMFAETPTPASQMEWEQMWSKPVDFSKEPSP